MTDDDYLARSARIQDRLRRVREQIEGVVRGRQSIAQSKPIQPLMKRQQKIIGELEALEREFWPDV